MKYPIFDIDPINSTICSFCSAYCDHRQNDEIITTNTLPDYDTRTIYRT
jgi:hypothetical protein